MSACLDSLLDPQRRSECRKHDEELQASMRTVTRAARMVTTPAGITIGIAYTPPMQRQGLHAERIQAALLEPRTAAPLTGWRALFGVLWRAC